MFCFKQFISNLPDIVDQSRVEEGKRITSARTEDSKMKIAWRYSNQARLDGHGSQQQQQRVFDAGCAIETSLLTKVATHAYSPTPDQTYLDQPDQDERKRLFAHLKSVMASSKYGITKPGSKGVTATAAETNTDKNLLRIALMSVSSPLCSSSSVAALPAFLLALRGQLRARLGVAFLSCSRKDFMKEDQPDEEALSRVIECCDYVITLKPFNDKMR